MTVLNIAKQFAFTLENGVEKFFGFGEQEVPDEIAGHPFVQAHTVDGIKQPAPGSQEDLSRQFENRPLTDEAEGLRAQSITNPVLADVRQQGLIVMPNEPEPDSDEAAKDVPAKGRRGRKPASDAGDAGPNPVTTGTDTDAPSPDINI